MVARACATDGLILRRKLTVKCFILLFHLSINIILKQIIIIVLRKLNTPDVMLSNKRRERLEIE